MDSNSIGVTSASSVQAQYKTNMWFVYMLLCDQKTFYVGITDQLSQRFSQHKNKQNISTKKFSDFKLVYAERYENKYEAAKREKQFKGWSHAKKQMLVDGKIGINTCTEVAEDLLGNLNS
ncbi:MAG TPA: GIY-YIG nuclease family protein [Patescibacteria group bacterium]|nr:GIY-YIG nuclease family protein [Patescibacteria group bacterium]